MLAPVRFGRTVGPVPAASPPSSEQSEASIRGLHVTEHCYLSASTLTHFRSRSAFAPYEVTISCPIAPTALSSLPALSLLSQETGRPAARVIHHSAVREITRRTLRDNTTGLRSTVSFRSDFQTAIDTLWTLSVIFRATCPVAATNIRRIFSQTSKRPPYP